MQKITVFLMFIFCACHANKQELILVQELQDSRTRNQIMGLTAIVSVAAMKMTEKIMQNTHPGEDRFYWRSLLPLLPASLIICRCLYKELKPREK